MTEEGASRELIHLHFKVGPEHHRWRLDRFIGARIPRLSRHRIQTMIRSQPGLGGPSLRPSLRVREGQTLVLLRPAPVEPSVPRQFTVLAEDEQLLLIAKPAGLPVHATARFHRNTLTALLRERYAAGGRIPRICHRLDRETSGLMILARTVEAEVRLKRAFLERRVQKRYLAIVAGQPEPEGVIDLPLGPDDETGIRVRRSVRGDGQPARTRYRVLERRGAFALVEARPETGRQHQIRVHLAAIGHSVVGDKLYGADPYALLEYADHGWTEALAERLLLPRHALHAFGADFEDPATGEPRRVECPMPEDLVDFWRGAGLPEGSQPGAAEALRSTAIIEASI